MKDKFKLSFGLSDGRKAELELCCFCKRIEDMNHPEKCEYFADSYDDNQCTAFIKVDDPGKRLMEALDAKCEKVNP